MSYMKLLLVILIATSIILPVSAQTTLSSPPITPEARERVRLNNKQIKQMLSTRLYQHNDAIMMVASDCVNLSKTLHPDILCNYRWLSLHNVPEECRQDHYAVVSFLLNSLTGIGLKTSARPTIVKPIMVGPNNLLIRIDLAAYHINPAAWDRLGAKDPYFHQLIKQQEIISESVTTIQSRYWKGGPDKDGEYFAPGYYDHEVTQLVATPGKSKTIQALASWCDTNAQKMLVTTLRTPFPVLRADWWIANVSLDPAYTDFLGVKTLDDFKKLVGFDANAKVTETKATVIRSGDSGYCPKVARNNRILARRSSFNGYYWETFDFLTSVGENNVINNFRNNKRDAGEIIASLPNGLQAYLIIDGKDKVVADGNTNIVTDSMAHDFTVKTARSCIWCHPTGINKFKSQFQLQIGYRPDQSDLAIYDKDPKKAYEIQQEIKDVFGLPNFDELIDSDSNRYNKAVIAATGKTSIEMSRLFKTFWDNYQEDYIDPNKFCYEIGLQRYQLDALLTLRLNGISNGVLIQALLKPPLLIRRDQFEEAFSEIGLLSIIVNKMPPRIPMPEK